MATHALWTGFLRSAERFPDRPALVVEGETLSYDALRQRALGIAATLQAHAPDSETPFTAVFAYRSAIAYAGVLGSLLAGHGYVPLNRTFPAARSQRMLMSAGCRSLIVDQGSLAQLDELLEPVEHPLLILVPAGADLGALSARWPRHTFRALDDLEPADAWRPPDVSGDAIAYLLFTSGSTGIPKGVMVAQRNVVAYVDYMVDRYAVTHEDRLSQMFDMTFDLSVHDMFVCWERGACLCCPSQKELISPGRFIQEQELTMWFSVPSTAVFMKRLGLLKPGRYPSLRVSLFCGEPLPVAVAEAWLEAAPGSIVENLYGPTELTIACTLYRWAGERSRQEAELEIVPIGEPYPGMKVLVADAELREVAPGEEGELLMNGPQMTLGYWKDAEKTAAAFVTPPGMTETYYRTGDRVRRPAGDAPLTHLGRVDHQVKIRGHRVELGEVEAVVRRRSGADGVVAIGWPAMASGYGGVEVFIEGPPCDVPQLREELAKELPDYMLPRRIHFYDRLPKNVNDKFDRTAMAALLEED